MYKSVKKSVGTHSHPSHPRWDIFAPNGARIATINNIIHAEKIVRLLNGQDRDMVEITNSVESIVIPKGAN